MITLDLLGALLPAGMVTGLVTVVYLERVTLGMEEAIAAGLLGGIATKLFVGRIQMTLGRYVRLRGKNT